MTITINQITSGMAIRINHALYLVNEYQHVKPGKGSAFVRVKLKNIKTNAVIEKTFKTADKLEDVSLEEKELEYLYRDGETFHFMDHTTYEEVVVSRDDLGNVPGFLLENLTVTGLAMNHKILKVILPNFIEARIAETDTGLRGDSSKAGTKPAKIATGAGIQVPLFINIDDTVKIDTRTGQYVERVKS